ncbi:MAG: RtcB family protein [Planctomycetota bacterium]
MSEPATIATWLAEPLSRPVRQAVERLAKAEGVRHVAVLPDVHLAESVCVGTALATERWIYPRAVGSDIGCGMATIALKGDACSVDDIESAADILSALPDLVPIHRLPRRPELPGDLEPDALRASALRSRANRDGRVQFGTLGRGNHFLELQVDGEGLMWVMVHSGSRAMGPAILAYYLKRATVLPGGWEVIDAESEVGQEYLADAEWAVRWATASRWRMLTAATDWLAERFGFQPLPETRRACVHNLVRRESPSGIPWWIHRKGAMSARDGELGLIPGSMAAPSYHVTGRGNPGSLFSSSHGAGRRLSRTEARRQITRRELCRDMQGIWFDRRAVDHLVDEAPAAYKDIGDVMRAQRDLVRIERVVQPRLSYKGR